MDQLPAEIRREILQLLDLDTLKALRQVSKDWADLGEEYMISSTFVTYLHRDDFGRLQSLSEHPRFPSYIRRLEINLGEVNEYHARHNTYFMQYLQDPEYRNSRLNEAWAYHGGLKTLKEVYAPKVCDPSLLEDTFKQLQNLESIAVSLHNMPGFTNELFQGIWRFPTTRALPRVWTWERFTSILTAVSSSNIQLKSLSHDRLPFEFFTQRPTVISQLSTTVTNLQFLSLQLDYSDSPNAAHHQTGLERLSQFLRSAPLVKTLHLVFQGRTKILISPLLSNLEAHAASVETLSLGDKKKDISSPNFPFLETLMLDKIATTEFELAAFITRHPTLRRLQLGGPGLVAPHHSSDGGIQLTSGTFKGLFSQLKFSLDIEKFNAQGEFQEIESSSRMQLQPVWTKEWVDLKLHERVETKCFEDFIVRKVPWDPQWMEGVSQAEL
ncbi:hypothetical protein BP6252_13482 [Coleophoma cylindrospora]|uniref:F-box domain-containing protein n=1 Tax=Coleophoma cylindrospora TaxID=1849047 RepID=A0A3D8Q8E5_9HELO|nr:hypothetical protein BP6252_13482 [Coleophoma cylindrospora]